MAALTVVMVLFFVMALVAAYTNRNLIFEQRISANTYRGAKSVHATDAGIDWTVALLNGGRIDERCRPTVDQGQTDFRRRYLVDSDVAPGGYSVRANTGYPACINNLGALSCICPSVGNPAVAIGAPADGSGSTFRIAFVAPGLLVRSGAIEFMSRGCATPGSGISACYNQTIDAPIADALSAAISTVGLVQALPLPPVAALTAGRNINVAGGTLNVSNGDAGKAITAHAGGDIAPLANVHAHGPAGSTADGLRALDAALSQLRVKADDGWFRSLYGMDPTNYQFQPATLRRDCALAGCNQATLTPLVAGYPRNMLWFTGDLTLNDGGTLGSAADPVFLIVTGTLTLSSNVTIVGYVHARNIVWGAGASAASLQGAMVATDDFTAQGTATLDYNGTVMELIRLRYGSFVRVPGSWNVFNPSTPL